MKVADKHDAIRGRREAAGQFLGRVRWHVEVPEFFDLVRIELRLHVREEAPVDLLSWL